MDDIIFSPLLKEIFEHAALVGGDEDPFGEFVTPPKVPQPVTAERFLIAAIERSHTLYGSEAERSLLRRLLERKIRDLDKAKQALLDYINHHDATREDELRFAAIADSTAYLGSDGKKTLVSFALALKILREPPKAVQPFLQAAGAQPPKAEAPSGDAFSQQLESRFKNVFDLTDADGDAPVSAQEVKGVAKGAGRQKKRKNPKNTVAELIADVKRIRKQLRGAVLGQDHAVNTFASGYFQACMRRLTDKSAKRPRATFLFAGPPGVGKTFLAEQVADALHMPFRRFDMSEYADKEANIEFCGSDRVYKNGKPGNVTSFVSENPQCVLLFDEVEKAHMVAIHLFLQILDAGRLRDNFTDEVVSFADTIIILTTNAGKQLYEETENGDFSSVSRKVIMQALAKDINHVTKSPLFPAAICSRFASGNVVMFNRIEAHNLRTIAQKEIERSAAALEAETEIAIRVDERVYSALMFAEGAKADARTVRGRAESFWHNELYELLRLIASEKVNTDVEDLQQVQVNVDLSDAPEAISALFSDREKSRILILADPKTTELCRSRLPGMTFVPVQDPQAGITALAETDIDLVLLDMRWGAADKPEELNLEDVDSPARDLFHLMKERQTTVPVYLLEERKHPVTDEEKVSYQRQGIRDVIRVAKIGDSFVNELSAIAASLHQQSSMVKLARENKLLCFETAQTVSKDGKHAQIRLFDFRLDTAVDSEDAKNVLSAVSKPNVRFADVIGAEDAKKELRYFVEYLKDPKRYMGAGVKAPKGVLLYGPPGTGKTLLAKAMASEADVTFLAAEGNQFLKRYVGEGSDAVHQLFRTARKYAPSILFVDEIDAIAKERRGGDNGDQEATLTAFLTEMDGFISDPDRPVFVLAATNFDVEPGGDKSLDPALMRRFDRRVYIDLPGRADRVRFLQMKIAENGALNISAEQIDNIALRSVGMSLADLDSVVELALRTAIRQGSQRVTDAVLEEAFEVFRSGEKKIWEASQLERVARHEAGHALLCHLTGETPAYLTVVARGRHGGYMQHAHEEGKELYTRSELLTRIRTALGGRAAELVCYGEDAGVSTGAGGDLAMATNLARQLVCSFGMDANFGLAVISGPALESAEVRAAVNRILQQQLELAVEQIRSHRDKLDRLVAALLERSHLNGSEISSVMDNT